MIDVESHTSVGKVHCAILRLRMNSVEEVLWMMSSDTLCHTCMYVTMMILPMSHEK